MTEERFVAIEEYKDGILSYIIKDKLNFVPTIRFLNAQDMYWMHERLKSNQIVINNAEVTKENEELKQINQELNDELQETMGYLALKSGVEKENEQLKSEVSNLTDLISSEIEKNAKLSQKNNSLRIENMRLKELKE